MRRERHETTVGGSKARYEAFIDRRPFFSSRGDLKAYCLSVFLEPGGSKHIFVDFCNDPHLERRKYEFLYLLRGFLSFLRTDCSKNILCWFLIFKTILS
jgi:hypothetical protein